MFASFYGDRIKKIEEEQPRRPSKPVLKTKLSLIEIAIIWKNLS